MSRSFRGSCRAFALLAIIILIGACGGGSAEAPLETGSIRATVTTTGTDIDTAGYHVFVSGGLPTGYAIGVNGSRVVPDITTITHSVSLGGLDHNCHVVGADSLDVEVSASTVATASFTVACITPPPLHARIVYSWYGTDSSHFDIFAMDTDGTNRVQLTSASGYRARVSPDGRQILFKRFFPPSATSGGFAVEQIFWMRADGSGQRKFGPPCNDSRDAAWSRDGSRIAFVCDTSSTRSPQIWVMNADGTGAAAVSPLVDPFKFGTISPAWSPDGSRIAFSSGNRIWVMNANGTGTTAITSSSSDSWNVDWSPINDSLLYENYNTGAQDGIYIVNADGTGRRLFATTLGMTLGPVWSFDGHSAVFFADQVYVIHADGTQQEARTSTGGSDPTWSP